MNSSTNASAANAGSLPTGTARAALCLSIGAFLVFAVLVLFFGQAGNALFEGMEDRMGDIAWNQGIRFEEAGQYENAIGSYELALEGDFQSPADRTDALMRLGRIVLWHDSPEKALPYLEEAYASPDHTPWLYESLCAGLCGTNRFEEALEVTQRWQQATGLPSEYSAQAWYYQGLALNGLKRADEALQAFLEGAGVAPAERCDYESAVALYQRGQYERALPYVERYLARNTGERAEYLAKLRLRIQDRLSEK